VKGKSTKNSTHPGTKRTIQDAYHEDIHILELKEAAARRAQKNAIRMKELELQEKKHAARVKKMEMDAEIQKAQLNMLTNMASMFASGSTGVGGSGLSGPSTPTTRLGRSVTPTTENWVYSQASTSSGAGSQIGQMMMGAVPGSVGHSPDPNFDFSMSDLHLPN
jgi:hypothetical protein